DLPGVDHSLADGRRDAGGKRERRDEVEERRPDDRLGRTEHARGNHRCNRVRRVVEAVEEIEDQRDEDDEEDEGEHRRSKFEIRMTNDESNERMTKLEHWSFGH